MNRTDLIAAVAGRTGLCKKDAERIVCATFDTIAETVAKGGKVQLCGFGTFEAKQRSERVGRHPVTGQPVQIPATRSPDFKPSKTLKDLVGAHNEIG